MSVLFSRMILFYEDSMIHILFYIYTFFPKVETTPPNLSLPFFVQLYYYFVSMSTKVT